jgi:2-methylcitrate dehydratase
MTRTQAVHALGIAGTTSAALRLTRAGELSMWKGCAFAHAARNGVFAALLAREGMTGPAPLFEGDMGFCKQVSGPLQLPKLGGPAADDWMLPKTSIKFVPAEYHSQSAIAAAFELRPLIGDPARIRSIEIATFKTAVEIIGHDPEKWRPRTRETADHSLPYCTAVALVDGAVSAAQFTPERLSDPSLLDLVSRTSVVEDPSLSAGYPVGIPNRVRVTLHDGTALESEVSFPPGHDKNPLSDAQLKVKFLGLAEPAIGPLRASELWERLCRIDDDPRPHEAIPLLG